jgi:hypothetical protein
VHQKVSGELIPIWARSPRNPQEWILVSINSRYLFILIVVLADIRYANPQEAETGGICGTACQLFGMVLISECQ